jgi:predicted metal-binding membrane protein
MPMVSPAVTALMMVATMVAMMLPSVAPTLWRCHHHLRARHVPRAAALTMVFAAGYAIVWSAMGLSLFAMSVEVSIAPWAVGAVILGAGVLQRSRWKAARLLRCRSACVPPCMIPANIATALRGGYTLGIDCVLSCAAPMAVLFVTGVMDARMMIVITAAITAERVAPGGVRLARLTGALAVVVAFVVFFLALPRSRGL